MHFTSFHDTFSTGLFVLPFAYSNSNGIFKNSPGLFRRKVQKELGNFFNIDLFSALYKFIVLTK